MITIDTTNMAILLAITRYTFTCASTREAAPERCQRGQSET